MNSHPTPSPMVTASPSVPEPPLGAQPRARWLLAAPWLSVLLCWPATLLGWYYLTVAVPGAVPHQRLLLGYLVSMLALDSAICVVVFLRITPATRAILRGLEPPTYGVAARAWLEAISLPSRMGLLIVGLIALTVAPIAVHLWWLGDRPLVLHGLVAAAIAGACELTLLFPLFQTVALPFLQQLRAAQPSLRLGSPGAIPPPLRGYFAFGLTSLASVSLALIVVLIHTRGQAGASGGVPEGPAILLASTGIASMVAGIAFHVWQAVLVPTRGLAQAMVAFSSEARAEAEVAAGEASAGAPASRRKARRPRVELLSVGDIGLLCERFDDMVDELARSRIRLAEHEGLLRHAQRFEVMGMMAGSFAHEVSNPLATLVANVDAAAAVVAKFRTDGRTPPAAAGPLQDAGEALADAARAAEQLAFLVRDMRAFGRKGPELRREVALAEVLDGAIRLAGGEFVRVGGVVRDYQPCGRVEGSPQKLTQVFLNLLLNAVQAVPEDGCARIRVRVRQVGETAEASVEDNGSGIPPEVQARLFEPLFTTKPEGKGTGLGLHLSRQIVVEHGGRIEFESRPAEGTVFRVLLPVVQLAAERAEG